MTTTTEMTHRAGNGSAPLAAAPDRVAGEPAPAALSQRRALMPANYQEAFAMAGTMARSGLFAVKSAEQAVVILMTGMELGLAPAQAMRGIYVVQSRPVLSADMMVAICKSARDVCRYFRVVETTDERATYETHRVGDPEPTRLTYTMGDAKRAGLANKETFRLYPAQLLRARCSSGLARVAYPDLLLGLYTPEELEELPAAPAPANQSGPEAVYGGEATVYREPGPQAQRPQGRASDVKGTDCEECGLRLTPGQASLSWNKFARALCPDHQRGQSPPGAAARPLALPQAQSLSQTGRDERDAFGQEEVEEEVGDAALMDVPADDAVPNGIKG